MNASTSSVTVVGKKPSTTVVVVPVGNNMSTASEGDKYSDAVAPSNTGAVGSDEAPVSVITTSTGSKGGVPISVAQGLGLFTLCVFPSLVILLFLSPLAYGAPVYLFLYRIGDVKYAFYAVGATLMVCLYIFDYGLLVKYNVRSQPLTVIIGVGSFYILLAGALTRTKYSPHVSLLVVLFEMPLYLVIARYTFCRKISSSRFFRCISRFCFGISLVTIGIWMYMISKKDAAGRAWWDQTILFAEQDLAPAYASHGEDFVALNGGQREVLCRASETIALQCHHVGIDINVRCKAWIDEECRTQMIENRVVDMNYKDHCEKIDEPTSWSLSSTERANLKLSCKYAKTLTFVLWSGPFICCLTTMAFAIFAYARQFLICVEGTDRVVTVEAMLKVFTLVLLMLVMSAYIAAEVAGASMLVGSIVLNFSGAGFVCICAWGTAQFSLTELRRLASKSYFISAVVSLPDSPVAQAAFVIGLNFFIFFFFMLDWLTQRMRRCQKARFERYEAKGFCNFNPDAKFTPIGMRLRANICSWHWVSVASYVLWWGAAFMIFFVGFAKITYVFLAWLNVELSPHSFGVVVAIYYATGLVMFLLPPVPGIPVYILGGVLFGYAGACRCEGQEKSQCNEVTVRNPGNFAFADDCVGFWPAVFIGAFIALAVKLTAVAMQQKLIGEGLGRFTYIKNLVGVHQPFMRAIEKLLREGTGLTVAKVGILCGGPDWPTSVLTGILHLPLFQMLLGTIPCGLLTTPCILSGALLLRQAQVGVWGPVSALALTLAGILQMLSMGAALYSIQNCLSKNAEELQAPREEHKEVEELAREIERKTEDYRKRTTWNQLFIYQKLLLTMSVLLMMFFMCGTFFLGTPGISFRAFDLSGKINDPYVDGGLNGDPLSIVLFWGWVEIGAFGASLVFYWLFLASSGQSHATIPHGSDVEAPADAQLQPRPAESE